MGVVNNISTRTPFTVKLSNNGEDRQTDRQTYRQTDEETAAWIARQTDY